MFVSPWSRIVIWLRKRFKRKKAIGNEIGFSFVFLQLIYSVFTAAAVFRCGFFFWPIPENRTRGSVQWG